MRCSAVGVRSRAPTYDDTPLTRQGHQRRRDPVVAEQPQRYVREYTVVARRPGDGAIRPGDDARGVKAFRLSELRDLHYAFDHDSIISAYMRWREKHATQARGSGHSTEPWVHTACV